MPGGRSYVTIQATVAMRKLLAATGLLAGTAVLGIDFVACTVGVSGEGSSPGDASLDVGADVHLSDAGPPSDSGGDAALDASDAGAQMSSCSEQNCGGACCGGTCMPRACGPCDAGPYFCLFHKNGANGYCTSDCSGCHPDDAAAGVECFTCASGTPVGSCAESANDCPQDLQAGACPCPDNDAGECPGATQVCTSVNGHSVCLTP